MDTKDYIRTNGKLMMKQARDKRTTFEVNISGLQEDTEENPEARHRDYVKSAEKYQQRSSMYICQIISSMICATIRKTH